uniref:Uncharacterized LOC100177359 n=1 Tax=Ciona intestinalis TaxID=7719 RepID=F7AZK0_CIOIN|nr:uncharacterized protein LOC100177359 [Ciona intestinalis]|eukprot:XP_002126420.1 uncharacterized protein LOC100177359 [Ciona intestinalis]
MRLFILVGFLFSSLICQVLAQTCAGNGNCDEQCLYRGSGSRTCGCQCLSTLNADGRTCDPTFQCGTDIYIVADASIIVDPTDCLLATIPGFTTTWPGWTVWKKILVAIFSFFVEEEAHQNINVGAKLFASLSDSPIIANYTGGPTVMDALNTIQGMNQPLCGSLSSYVRHIGQGVEKNPGLNDWVYRGPYSFRPFSTTARVAIALNYGPSNTMNEQTISFWRERILQQFDRLIVITRSNISVAADKTRNDREARLFACGHPTAPCAFVLYIDALNDFGLPLSNDILSTLTSSTSCLERLAQNITTSLTSCDSNMTLTIPKCKLRGLTPSDLRLNDVTCNVATYTREVGDNYIIDIPYGVCGATQELQGGSGGVLSLHKQMVQTRNFSASQLLPSVKFNIECTAPTQANTSSITIKPAAHLVEGKLVQQGNFPLSLDVYTNSSFSTKQTGNLAYVIDCPVYIEGSSSPISDGLTLKLWTCTATPTSNINDPVSYALISNGGCQKDPTVEFQTRASPGQVRFKFNMFEFVSNRSALEVQRGPVYIHCSFIMCRSSDTTGRCGQVCHSRRKRTTESDDGESVTKSVGPFTLKAKGEKDGTSNEDVEISRDDADFIQDDTTNDDTTNDDITNDDITQGRRIEFVVEGERNRSTMGDAAFIFVIVFGCYFALRYFQDRMTSGVVPGACVKHPLEGYIPAQPDWCDKCCHKPVPTGLNQSDPDLHDQKPPEYQE